MKHSIIGTLLDVECRTCLFFEETQGLGSGFCKKNAPREINKDGWAAWPKVDKTNGCGAYQPSIKAFCEPRTKNPEQ